MADSHKKTPKETNDFFVRRIYIILAVFKSDTQVCRKIHLMGKWETCLTFLGSGVILVTSLTYY